MSISTADVWQPQHNRTAKWNVQLSHPLLICGGLNLVCLPDAHQAALWSPTMSTGHGEKVRWNSSWVEIKPGRLLINYYHRQNRLHMGKIKSPIKNGVGWCEIKIKLKSSPPQPSSQASLLHSQVLPPLPVMTGGMGLAVSAHSSSQLLLSAHSFFLLQHVVPPMG